MSDYIGNSSHLFAANEAYVADIYGRYLKEPNSVSADWAQFFAGLSDGEADFLRESVGAPWKPRETHVVGGGSSETAHLSLSDTFADAKCRPAAPKAVTGYGVPTPSAPAEQIRRATLDSIRAIMLIRAFRMRGHMEAKLDPLDLNSREKHGELDPATYGFEPSDWDRSIFINYYLGLETATLRDIVKICRQTYCGNIGVEFMHIQEPEEKAWIQERIEGDRNRTDFTNLGKRTILERLTQADVFEAYLDKKYKGTKRFGLDGGEALVPMIEQILKRGAQLGLEDCVFGMAHRGRLNVLANIMNKPYRAIFSEFKGVSAHPLQYGSGDVKYHLGTSSDREFDGKTVHLSLTANHSHLECVNTVVLGKVRAKQRQRGGQNGALEKVMGVLLHGDAAFIGQGIVAETFLLSQLDGYKTGGTIHICINNQIGFTTAPSKSRSSPYPTDMAKMIDAPVFHVNGDDPEACVHVARIATEYRQRFKKDVVLDLWCYRRHGHNEGDEPMFTQPLMYTRIKDHARTRAIYAKRLEAQSVIGPQEAEKIIEDFTKHLDAEFEASESYRPNKADWLEGRWAGIGLAEGDARRGETGVSLELLREVGHAISTAPANFNVNPKIARQLEAKKQMLETGEGVDWGTAEALAFGTLLCESTAIRLSGEDSERGTFSHRHSVLIDQVNESRYVPLNNIRVGQAPFEVIDSPLSEFGLLGFEYGYATAEPHALVLWEAQFGDFANGAQVIIDQFIAAGESKWLRMCGLVMLLPHGYEGQGPEHSSARLERYLQLCAEDNLQVANCTTPANFFHILRRQMRRSFRKPLIIMSPKSLLRHKKAVSPVSEFIEDSTFHRVVWDRLQWEKGALVADEKIRKVVLCSGKVYYDLDDEREKRGVNDVYILRVEQLYPFPASALAAELKRFPNAEVVWCQEEPENNGAWFFMDRRIEAVLGEIGHKQSRPIYVGRAAAASPAAGSAKRHAEEQAALVNEALTVSVASSAKGGKAKSKAKAAE